MNITNKENITPLKKDAVRKGTIGAVGKYNPRKEDMLTVQLHTNESQVK